MAAVEAAQSYVVHWLEHLFSFFGCENPGFVLGYQA